MTDCEGHFTTGVFLNGEEIKEVNNCKYIGYIRGYIISDKGSKI